MTEQWVRWEPASNLAFTYYTESISDYRHGFKVVLFNETHGTKVGLTFENCVFGYRYTDESFRPSMISDLHKKYGTKFYAEWMFFKVENSSYIKWISEQSFELADPFKLMHFCLLAADAVIDIAANYEPKVEVHRM